VGSLVCDQATFDVAETHTHRLNTHVKCCGARNVFSFIEITPSGFRLNRNTSGAPTPTTSSFSPTKSDRFSMTAGVPRR
jgi:hypothetical protein